MVMALFCLLPLFAHSADNELLKCLGKEEKAFHLKKQTGPVYDLNQRLISEMVQIPHATVAPEYIREICSSKHFSASWKLLELSLKKGKDIFIIPPNVEEMQKQITAGMVEDFIEGTREILLNFISAIQTISPTPNCLKEEIPELDNFFMEIKYLQEDVDLKNIFQGKDQKIFNRLKDYPRAFQRCRDRLKKKPKSGSVPEARKP
jgi:hypothetical protein